jgi:hypothetical protein
VEKSLGRLWADEEKAGKQSVEQIVDQTVEYRTVAAECGAGVEWSVEAATRGARGRNRVWSRWTEQTVEQVDGADCGTSGLSRLWKRWTEQTVEQGD